MKPTILPVSTKRFAGLVNQPGGATLAEAVRGADANLERLRETALSEIQTTLDRMHELGAQLQSGPNVAAMNELYTLSNTIVGVAGVFGLGHVGSIAYSLCELVDRLRLSGRSKASAIQVHLDSLRLMHATSPTDTRKAASVQQALQRIVDSIPVGKPLASGGVSG